MASPEDQGCIKHRGVCRVDGTSDRRLPDNCRGTQGGWATHPECVGRACPV